MAGGSKLAVYTAIGANSVVMVAKFIGFGITGSGSMLAEGIHSVADVGNQTLLAVGMNRAARPPDDEHPEGYGREAFIWALISAVGIFFLGCGVTVAHGVNALLSAHPHEVADKGVAIGILLFSLVIEGASLGVAVRELRRAARTRGLSLREHLRTTDDPFGIAILYEDGAAVLGVIIALCALGLAELTHLEWFDAVGSIAVGLLLGVLAVNLIGRNRSMLIGKSVAVHQRDKLEKLLADDPAIDAVAISRAIVDGSRSFRVSAEIDFNGHYVAEKYLEDKDVEAMHRDLDSAEKLASFLEEFGEAVMTQIGDEIDRIETRLAERMPSAKNIDLEPD